MVEGRYKLFSQICSEIQFMEDFIMVEITYHKEGDYFVPDLYLEKENYENDYIIGKYGHLRLEYLKNHKKAEYIIMFMNKTLRKHIVETDKQAKQRFEMLMATNARKKSY